MKEMPLVSIGMPVYNDLPFLSTAIDSLLGQSYPHFELIISDDCSTDGSEQVCRAYAAKDQRIRYIRQERNLGVSGNMNYLLQQARGEYFMLAADDDFWDPYFIEILLHTLQENDQLMSAFCPMVFVDEKNEVLTTPAPRSSDYSGNTAFNRLLKFARIFDDGLGYGLFRIRQAKGLQFPVWKGINRQNAYDNLYPPISFLLAKGNMQLVGERPLWFNRYKTGDAVHHQTPFPEGTVNAGFAIILRKLNLISASFSQIKTAGQWFTAILMWPVMIWYWLICPLFAGVARRISQLSMPEKESPGRMVLYQLLVHFTVFGSLPVIGRMFPASAVGEWGFFQSSVLILWSFSQLKTDNLLITAENESEKQGLFLTGTVIHLVISLLAGILLLIFGSQWHIPTIALTWLVVYWIGFGISNLISSWFTAQKAFSGVNYLRLTSTILAYPGSFAGWYLFGNSGLIACLVISVWLPVVPVIFRPLTGDLTGKWSNAVRAALQRIRKEGFWMTANTFIITFSDQIFTLVIAGIYNLPTAASFFFVQRIMMAPVSLMVGTYGLYFYRQFFEMSNSGRLNSGVFITYWLKWLPVALLFYGILGGWAGLIFGFLFGDNYSDAGLWSGALALRCSVQFLASPLSIGFYAIRRPRIPFFMGIISLLITLSAIGLMSAHILPLPLILWIHSILMVLNILIYNFFMLLAVRENRSTY